MYRTSLEDVRKHMESALELYGRQATLPAEVQHYSALRAELMGYWGILAPIFQWDAAERRRSGYAFLRDEVFPRRQNMLAIADRIAAINEQQLTAGNDQVVSLLLRFQTRLLVTLLAALVLGLGMAFFSTRKISDARGSGPPAVRGGGRRPRPAQGPLCAAGTSAGNRAAGALARIAR